MKAKSVQEAMESINEHIQFVNKNYSLWYVGTSDDAERDLYNEYAQTNIFSNYTSITCEDIFTANEIAQKLVSMGCVPDSFCDRDDATDVYGKLII